MRFLWPPCFMAGGFARRQLVAYMQEPTLCSRAVAVNGCRRGGLGDFSCSAAKFEHGVIGSDDAY